MSSFKQAIFRFISAWMFVVSGAVLSQFFEIPHLITSTFADYSPLYKILYMYGVLKCEMQTYYIGFTLNEACVMMCGLSYSGHDEQTREPKFTRIKAIHIWNMESSYTVKGFMAAWNMSG